MSKTLDKKLDEIELEPIANEKSTQLHGNTRTNDLHQSQAMSETRRALPQYCASGALSLLEITFGATFGFTTIIIAELEELRKKDEDFISLSQLTWQSSLNYIAILIGTIFSGVLSQWLGRRRALILSTFPYVASWILLYMCEKGKLWPIFLGTFLFGCSGGLTESSVQVYVAEISEPRLRGVMSASTGVSFLAGHFLETLMGKYLDWRTLALVNACFSVLAVVSLTLVPESPYWLASKGRYEESLKALAWLRGWCPVGQLPQDEFRAILSTVAKKTDDKPLPVKRYFKRSAMMPFALINFLFLLTCFTGSVSFLPWAIPLFKEIHSPIGEYDATIILTAIQLVATIALMIMLPYTGKRMPTLASLALSGLAFLAASLYMFFAQESAQANWLPTVAILFAVGVSFVGIRHAPWMLAGEVFTSDVSSILVGILATCDEIYAATATKSFFYTKQTLTLPGTFLLFASINFIGLVALFFVMPETEGKNLAEIHQYFRGCNIEKKESVADISVQDP